MSKSQMLRAFVNQRLSAAAEEIFLLFERTILEYEEKLCRSVEENRRKQRLLDTVLSPTVLPHTAATGVHAPPLSPPGPSPRLNPEITETGLIKAETEEEQGVKREEELLPVPDYSTVVVKTEDASLPQHEQTEHKEAQGEVVSSELNFTTETEGYSEPSGTGLRDDWTMPLGGTADPEHHHPQQIRDGAIVAQFSGVPYEQRPAPETSAAAAAAAYMRDTSGSGRRAERKKYQCFVCQKLFESKLILQIHIRVHTGEKPYSCPICKKAFAQKNNLNAHRKTHTGEKPYSCSLCHKTFVRRCTLKRHMKIHSAEKALNRAFTVTFDPKMHENSHRYV